MKQDILEQLLQALEGDLPTGENLEYDPEFLALERAAAPKAERAMGDSVKAAEEPDWQKVAELAQALLGRSKDLRIAVHLTTAWLRTSGLPGWAAGLGLIRGLLDRFWDVVHPQLDADDNNDPTFRVNSVAPLSNAEGMLRYLRTTAFVQSRRLGGVSLRDLRIATGTLKLAASDADADAASASTAMTLVAVEACCMDCPEDQLAGAVTAVVEALEHVKAIDTIFNDHLGPYGPDLKGLLGDIHELKKFLEPILARRTPQAGSASHGAGNGAENDAGEELVSSNSASTSGQQITGAKDVIRKLEELCNYYARFEPSSPVPLLLRRAQRLVGKDFLGLLKDLAPAGVGELQMISGVKDAGEEE